ncbi:MAG TPA: carbon storage regulator [Gammaproteobacteria bacterium]|jgi:carbon storage regulator|nr:carbon storage regulator [Gammaproteobacteria bacterium]HQW57924.1 carbon storage regulator [Gammaproteobacteria bacterium]
MLILKRCAGESIKIGKDIEIIVLGHSLGITRIGITAPKDTKILRKELWETLQTSSYGN